MFPLLLPACFVLACYASLFMRPHVTPFVILAPRALDAASIHLPSSAFRLLAVIHRPSLALTSTPLVARLPSPPAISSWALQSPPPASTPFTWMASASPKQNVSAQRSPAIPDSPAPIFPFPLLASPRPESPPLQHQSSPPLPMCAPNDAPVNSSVPQILLFCPSPYFTITLNAPRSVDSSALKNPTPPALQTLRTLSFKPAQGGFGRAGTRPFEYIVTAFAILAVAGTVAVALESSPPSSEGNSESDEPDNDNVGFEDNDEPAAAAIHTNNGGVDDDPEDTLPASPGSVFDDDLPELPLPDHDIQVLLLTLLTIAHAGQHLKLVEPVARTECIQNATTSTQATEDAPSTDVEQHEGEQVRSELDLALSLPLPDDEDEVSASVEDVEASTLEYTIKEEDTPQEVNREIVEKESGELPTRWSLSPDAVLVEAVPLNPTVSTPPSQLGLSCDVATEPSHPTPSATTAASASTSEVTHEVVTPCNTFSSYDLALLVPLPDDDDDEVHVPESGSRFVIKREKGGRVTFIDSPSTPAEDICEPQPRSSCKAEVNRAGTSSSTSKVAASALNSVNKGQSKAETTTAPAPKKKAALVPLGVKLDGLGYWVPRLGTTVEIVSEVIASPAQEPVSTTKQEKPEGEVEKSVESVDTPKSASGATTQQSAPESVTILKREKRVGAKTARASSAKDAAFVASADRLMETLKAERAKLVAEAEKDKAVKEAQGCAFEKAMSAIRDAQAVNIQSSTSSHRAPHLPIPAPIQKPMIILRHPSPPAPPCDENKASAAGPSTTSGDDESKHDGHETIASTTPPTPPQPTSTDDENDNAVAAGPSNPTGGEAVISKQQLLNRRRRQRKYVLKTVGLFAQLPGDDVYLDETRVEVKTEEEKHEAPVSNAKVVEEKENGLDTTVLAGNSQRRNSITSGTRIGPSTCPAGELETGDPEEVDVTAEERRRWPTT